ncbi:hypothetical protein SERLADRAFT_478825 [Serpula lacrymans var. lacrymans S7.9]|uniref:Secreted protein n=1 Tax=Serpula lacrymans var. lacrymans (strain S7.9) TaxID=578457 RepID=F8PAY8_SERL9|nr:uncharacterized protein SERLADRAFT_478825 [Serpula lacrymans var. lacrymans S7.9]EGO19428.1 hypothetical protein SERLADRAFT_478825 [Serpula lacrymans var. lacrymans S7.9]
MLPPGPGTSLFAILCLHANCTSHACTAQQNSSAVSPFQLCTSIPDISPNLGLHSACCHTPAPPFAPWLPLIYVSVQCTHANSPSLSATDITLSDNGYGRQTKMIVVT